MSQTSNFVIVALGENLARDVLQNRVSVPSAAMSRRGRAARNRDTLRQFRNCNARFCDRSLSVLGNAFEAVETDLVLGAMYSYLALERTTGVAKSLASRPDSGLSDIARFVEISFQFLFVLF